MASSNSSSSSTLPTFITPPAINMHKLTKDNYTTWKAQIVPYLLGFDLFGYVDGTIPKPSATLPSTSSTDNFVSSSPNPAHAQWIRQDALILTRAVHLRSQLSTIRKGSQTATDYFFTVKKITDELAIAGQTLSCDDVITYILAGLGHDYDSLVTTVIARKDSVTLEELYSLLLTTESRLAANNSASLIFNGSANLSTRANDTAKKCYHRFDITYTDQPANRQMQAMVAANNQSAVHDWHPDTGATHHLTNEMTNLTLRNDDYDGTEQIQVGNGAGLRITKTGSSTLSTNSKSFLLQQILLVPEIQKNLLSVHQFCNDNNVYFEFHENFFLIKDYSGNILHHCLLKNGLYSFSACTNPEPYHAFSAVHLPLSLWHKWLGHASIPVVLRAVSKSSIPVEANKKHSMYGDQLLLSLLLVPATTCLDASTGKVYVSRHVIFDENSFPYQSPQPPSPPPNMSSTTSLQILQICPNEEPVQVSHPVTNVNSPVSLSQAHHYVGTGSELPTLAAIYDLHIDSSAELPAQQEPPVSTNCHSMVTRSKNGIQRPKRPLDGSIRYPLPRALLAAAKALQNEPTCYTEASKHSEWRTAMDAEFDALLRNGTWTLVPPTSNINVIGCKWVYCIKRRADGTVECYKARLVAKGFHQQQGLDFMETYSPVIKPATVRMHPQFPHHVYHLRRSLYGLRQAPRAWFSRLTDKLITYGFTGSKSDVSLFIYCKEPIIIFILIYVDDLIITGSSTKAITEVIKSLHSDFAIKDLGQLNFFVGVEALHCNNGLYLSQRQYVTDILIRSGMDKAKPCTTPMATSTKMSQQDSPDCADPTLFRSIVGSLHYLSFTGPNIAFAVHRAFADSDWAGDLDDRRSVGAYCIYLGSSLISWSFKQQATVARSSTEAEYKALANAAAELQWLQKLSAKLGLQTTQQPIIWCDNIGLPFCKSYFSCSDETH
ncbi:hypothetical protein F2P56_033290 [Juglans regia]|uniref:Reverse transcriptase Ty1/copia-type domain-containing protein n=1 Tax=Juglans regia TaxID=51240 RepID=A0A833SUP0_JUGRE|nr:hypothetical protein F2P56_033290 [Juglans regia]